MPIPGLLKKVLAAEEFILNLNSDEDPISLDFTMRYFARVFALKSSGFSRGELENMVQEFMTDKYEPNDDYEMLSSNFNTEEFPPEGVIINISGETDAMDFYEQYNAPYYYGKYDFWDIFPNKAGKTLHGSSAGITSSTNDVFNNLNIPYAKTQPVMLRITELGVSYTEYVPTVDGQGVIFMQCMLSPVDLTENRRRMGYYVYIYVPDGLSYPVRNVYRRSKGASTSDRYPNGLVSYSCFDPIDAVTGSFLWEYPDLKIPGKHSMEFKRYYDNQTDSEGTLGRNWSHNFDYTLVPPGVNNSPQISVKIPKFSVRRKPH